MNKNTNQKLNWSMILPLLIILLGTILLIYMITVEDEPGALPLLLIVSGIAFFIVNWLKLKRKSNTNE